MASATPDNHAQPNGNGAPPPAGPLARATPRSRALQRSFGEKMERNISRLPRRTWDSIRRLLGDNVWKVPHKYLVRTYWMKLGNLAQYPPRPLRTETFPDAAAIAAEALPPTSLTWRMLGGTPPAPRVTADADLPHIAIVTPSFQHAAYIRETMDSVLNQGYPNLSYVVQDGGSNDGTREILEDYAPRLHACGSEKDRGQAEAIRNGFERTEGRGEIMAWLNSDDTLLPGALHYIGRYFGTHPHVDAIYGHRILIDERGMEIGRWVLPPHNDEPLGFVDYVPQETLFWRRAIYEKVGGIDTTLRFAMDWDLLLRFVKAKARIVRVPYFLGCFRVHKQQRSSAPVTTMGIHEMDQIRHDFHGRDLSWDEVNKAARKLQVRATITSRLLEMGIRR
ncbi:glycosyltransferase [Verrucomicrobia bacterium LW23]|nr:glycosyltransferase [Verrucomicrobia bacterium LW23]